ncbi:MAG: RnfABCDGE type electron transport complex subunit D [Deltaproteobacteria bacterium]|jgi:electron transport complex protein RnfD|nr:RnfABCDGE type electron transport complex subunit D [Deltaproteobacteria bacterium]
MSKSNNITLGVSAPPYLHWGKTIPSVMKELCIALLPAAIMAVCNFGPAALKVIGLAILAAVLTEAVCSKMTKSECRLDDFHAVYIGMLVAFMLPADAPWWLPVIGSAVAVGLGKMLFGGLGANPLCPPAVAWAILVFSWPALMDASSVVLNSDLLDPLYRLKYFGAADADANFTLASLLLGQQMGGLGSSQAGALLVGGAFAAVRMNISIETPIGFIVGVLLLGSILNVSNPTEYASGVFHLFAGSTLFGAFFLATEFGGSPSRPLARLLYGMIAGAMTIVIRVFGIHSDGVPFAILLANLIMPFLDMIRPKPFGAKS